MKTAGERDIEMIGRELPVYLSVTSYHARAFVMDYTGKKFGEHPKKTELGLVYFPASHSLEEAEQAVRAKYPAANWCQIYDDCGKIWASCSI